MYSVVTSTYVYNLNKLRTLVGLVPLSFGPCLLYAVVIELAG